MHPLLPVEAPEVGDDERILADVEGVPRRRPLLVPTEGVLRRVDAVEDDIDLVGVEPRREPEVGDELGDHDESVDVTPEHVDPASAQVITVPVLVAHHRGAHHLARGDGPPGGHDPVAVDEVRPAADGGHGRGHHHRHLLGPSPPTGRVPVVDLGHLGHRLAEPLVVGDERAGLAVDEVDLVATAGELAAHLVHVLLHAAHQAGAVDVGNQPHRVGPSHAWGRSATSPARPRRAPVTWPATSTPRRGPRRWPPR